MELISYRKMNNEREYLIKGDRKKCRGTEGLGNIKKWQILKGSGDGV
jgi:hypothetical protein